MDAYPRAAMERPIKVQDERIRKLIGDYLIVFLDKNMELSS